MRIREYLMILILSAFSFLLLLFFFLFFGRICVDFREYERMKSRGYKPFEK